MIVREGPIVSFIVAGSDLDITSKAHNGIYTKHSDRCVSGIGGVVRGEFVGNSNL